MMQEYRTGRIYGDFYENEGKPLIVVIGGSRPGLPAPIHSGFLDYLKQHFQVLLLAYFGVGELPGSLERVPVEYFVDAVSFVKREYGIGDDEVIVLGQSKGGEAALLLTGYMKSAATIALVPGCYVFQGLSASTAPEGYLKGGSSWTFRGKELPYVKFYFDDAIVGDIMKGIYRTCYEASIERNEVEDAFIRVDGYTGKLFLLSEDNDRYWPSRMMAGLLAARSGKKITKHVVMNLDGHYLMNYKESTSEIIKFLNEI